MARKGKPTVEVQQAANEAYSIGFKTAKNAEKAIAACQCKECMDIVKKIAGVPGAVIEILDGYNAGYQKAIFEL